MSTHPPASVPAEEHRQSVDRSTGEEEQSTALDVAVGTDASKVVLDLTEPTRPFVIDLVRPEVGPRTFPGIGRSRSNSSAEWGCSRRVPGSARPSGSSTSSAAFDLIVFSPLMLVIAMAILLTSPGPVIYAQRRIGKDGHPFTMWKFRSMVDGAHEIRHRHARDNRHTVGPVFKIQNDPRITPVGRVIRRFSLDDFPSAQRAPRGHESGRAAPGPTRGVRAVRRTRSSADTRPAGADVHLADQRPLGRRFPTLGGHEYRSHPHMVAPARLEAPPPHPPGGRERPRGLLMTMVQVAREERRDSPSRDRAETAFIVGPARSGTTLLYKALCLHPQVAFISNWRSPFAWLPATAARTASLAVHRHSSERSRSWIRRLCLRTGTPDTRSPLPEPGGGGAGVHAGRRYVARRAGVGFDRPERRAPGGVRLDQGAEQRDVPRLQAEREQSADPQLHDIFPRARFVVLVRDGRAVAESLSRVDWWETDHVWWYGGTPTKWRAEGGDRWKILLGTGRRNQRDRGRLRAVPPRSGDEAALRRRRGRPTAGLESLAGFIGLADDRDWRASVSSVPIATTTRAGRFGSIPTWWSGVPPAFHSGPRARGSAMSTERAPSFAFVLGSGRCGSTLAHDVLARHPDVGFVSNVDDRLVPLRAARTRERPALPHGPPPVHGERSSRL